MLTCQAMKGPLLRSFNNPGTDSLVCQPHRHPLEAAGSQQKGLNLHCWHRGDKEALDLGLGPCSLERRVPNLSLGGSVGRLAQLVQPWVNDEGKVEG